MPFLKGKSILESRCRNLENLAKKNGLRHAIFTPLKDKYIGEWRNNIKEGKGFVLTRSGKLYEGDWANGFRHGFGILAVEGKNSIFALEYRGDWKKGKMHGYGVRHYTDGSYFLGNWKSGKRHGYGQMWYADGSFYDGFWVQDLRQGLGMFVKPDGNKYEGEWLSDLKNGKGRFFHLDNGQMQEGIWRQDNCCYSQMTNIPFRQTAVEAASYPIPQVELKDSEQICKKREDQLYTNKTASCLSVRIWV